MITAGPDHRVSLQHINCRFGKLRSVGCPLCQAIVVWGAERSFEVLCLNDSQISQGVLTQSNLLFDQDWFHLCCLLCRTVQSCCQPRSKVCKLFILPNALGNTVIPLLYALNVIILGITSIVSRQLFKLFTLRSIILQLL